MVYGDLGRYPFFVNLCIRAVKYWFKLLQMKENRLPKQAYYMQINENKWEMLLDIQAQRSVV